MVAAPTATAEQFATERMRAGFPSIPAHMHGGIERYVLYGVPPGGFLTALLSNDLMGALGKADDANRVALADWGAFLHNDTPSGCHGSREAVAAWIDRGGLLGARAA